MHKQRHINSRMFYMHTRRHTDKHNRMHSHSPIIYFTCINYKYAFTHLPPFQSLIRCTTLFFRCGKRELHQKRNINFPQGCGADTPEVVLFQRDPEPPLRDFGTQTNSTTVPVQNSNQYFVIKVAVSQDFQHRPTINLTHPHPPGPK